MKAMPPVPSGLEAPVLQADPTRHLMLLVVIGLTFGAYFVLRFLGLWSEQDTAVFTRILVDMQDHGSLTSPGAYTHGYAYPVWAATLSNLTGVPIPDLVQLYLPIIGNLFLGLFGFAAFRRLLMSDRLGFVAAGVLFLVPELVFTVSRGNHEKLTVALTLLALLALVNSFLEMFRTRRWHVFAAWVAVLYVTNFTLISLNAFFGSSFTVAATLTLIFFFLLLLPRSKRSVKLFRIVSILILAVSINWLLMLLVSWYIYPSAGAYFDLLDTALERLSVLFFGAEPKSGETFTVSDPYIVGSTDWASRQVYMLVSSFRWVLFLTSFAAWLLLLAHVVRQTEQVPLPRLFMLALYGAFGFLLAMAVPVDFTNLPAGTNLQVRMYTYFALLAPPVFVFGLAKLVAFLRPGAPRKVALGTIALLFSCFTVLSLLKATLDPLVSNRWHFYSYSEVRAIELWDGMYERSSLWIDVEARLRHAYAMIHPALSGSLNDNVFSIAPYGRHSAHALQSSINREAAVAWRAAPPALWLENRPYDNGEAQLYHRIPRTPFQR